MDCAAASSNAATGRLRGAPRVGDGLVRLNSEGEVLYGSPNAMSCFHRLGVLGDMVGRSLAQVIADHVEDGEAVDEALPLVAMGRAAWRTDVESRGVCVSLRAIPMTNEGERIGAVVLGRDVSELRRREPAAIAVVYVATGPTTDDPDWADRIAAHRERERMEDIAGERRENR